MIIQGLWSFFCTVIGGLIGTLPDGGTFNPDLTPVHTVLGEIDSLNTYLPVAELLIALAIALTITYARIPWAAFNWLWRLVRG